jgi:hypothetical protein
MIVEVQSYKMFDWDFFFFARRTYRELVAQACNPSYLGGGNQEDCGSRPHSNHWLVAIVPIIPGTQGSIN